MVITRVTIAVGVRGALVHRLRHVREGVAPKVAVVVVDVLIRGAVHMCVVATKIDGRNVLRVKLLVLLVQELRKQPVADLEVRIVDERLKVEGQFGVLQVSRIHLPVPVQVRTHFDRQRGLALQVLQPRVVHLG